MVRPGIISQILGGIAKYAPPPPPLKNAQGKGSLFNADP